MNEDKSPRNIPWLAIILLVFALVSFFAMSNQWKGGRVFMNMVGTDGAVPPMAATAPSPGYPGDMMESQGSVTVSASAPMVPQGLMAKTEMGRDAAYGGSGNSVSVGSMPMPGPNYYPYSYGDAGAKDTREFNKIYYSADMQTRDVQGVVKHVETTVRGHKGRVDNSSSSEKYGAVSFVVPQTEYDAFREEIESLVGPKFLTVNVNSQNMLPQKQGIEQQQKNVETSIDDLTAAKKKLASTHSSTVASLQSQIDANEREIAMLRTQTSNDPAVLNQIAARLNVLASEQTNFKNKISNENSSYAYQRDSLDLQIKYANSNLDAVKTADQNLLDNVATVSGSVSVRWISLWEIAQIYLPGYTIPGIFLVLAALAYWWHRRKGTITAI